MVISTMLLCETPMRRPSDSRMFVSFGLLIWARPLPIQDSPHGDMRTYTQVTRPNPLPKEEPLHYQSFMAKWVRWCPGSLFYSTAD